MKRKRHGDTAGDTHFKDAAASSPVSGETSFLRQHIYSVAARHVSQHGDDVRYLSLVKYGDLNAGNSGPDQGENRK